MGGEEVVSFGRGDSGCVVFLGDGMVMKVELERDRCCGSRRVVRCVSGRLVEVR